MRPIPRFAALGPRGEPCPGFLSTCWNPGAWMHPAVRDAGASGGAMSRVLIHLLESGRVDAVIVARQGIPSPEQASWHVARTREEILECAQSVYIPVPMLDGLRHLSPGKRYAITCVPEQSAALRVL